MIDHGPAVPGGRISLFALTITTVGVVYGDIGTSPLYTIKECFYGEHGVPVTHENVLGVLSLIIYALVVVISVGGSGDCRGGNGSAKRAQPVEDIFGIQL